MKEHLKTDLDVAFRKTEKMLVMDVRLPPERLDVANIDIVLDKYSSNIRLMTSNIQSLDPLDGPSNFLFGEFAAMERIRVYWRNGGAQGSRETSQGQALVDMW